MCGHYCELFTCNGFVTLPCITQDFSVEMYCSYTALGKKSHYLVTRFYRAPIRYKYHTLSHMLILMNIGVAHFSTVIVMLWYSIYVT